MEIKNWIHQVEEKIPAKYCEKILEQFEAFDDKHAGMTVSGVVPEFKISIDAMFDDCVTDEETVDFMRSYITRTIDSYLDANIMWYDERLGREINTINCGEFSYYDMQIQKYDKQKGHYNACHAEKARATDCIGIGVIYLNDVEEGGKTVFPTWGVEVQPKQGKVVMFPPFYTHIHYGEMPISSDKTIITFSIMGADEDSKFLE